MLMPDLATIALLVVGLVLAHGANARIARLIAEDDITAPIRAKAVRKWGEHNLLVRWGHCPWCCGWWTAWPLTAFVWFPIMGVAYWWLFLVAGWSVAHAAGRLNHDHGHK